MEKKKHNLFLKLTALAIFVLALASTGYALAYTGPGALTAGSGAGLMSVSGSNIGIGAASPVLPLQVKDNAVSYPYQAAQFTTTDWTTTVGSTFQIGHGASTGNTFSELRALTSGYNAWGNLIMQVGGGRVGIGTSTPAYTLDVNGNVRATAFVGALSGSMAADNVSSGSFGSLQGGGSYTFPASLGVGTTTAPSVKLDVFGTGAFGSMVTSRGGYSNGLSVQNLAATPTSLFLWENGVGSGHIGFRVNDPNLYIVNSNADGLITNPAAIALSSGGSVGIGTATPPAKLSIAGANANNLGAEIKNMDVSLLLYETIPDSSNAGSIQVMSGGTATTIGTTPYTLALNPQGGKVSVGTSSASDPLAVNGIIRSISGGFKFPDGTIQTTAGGGGGGQWTTSGTSIYYNTGNVGIGTTVPGAPLNIAPGSAQFPKGLMIDQSTHATSRRAAIDLGSNAGGLTSGWEIGQDSNGNGTKDFYIYDINSSAHRLNIGTTGNVGIGTTAQTAMLDVQGSNLSGIKYTRNAEDARILLASPSQMWSLASGWNNAPGNLNIIQEGVASRLTIASSTGNIGIGAIAPAYKLDVSGTGAFSQPILVGTPTAAGMAATKAYVDTAVSSGTANSSNFVNSPDGTRNAADKLPTTNARTVRFDFATAASAGTGGIYAGVMTYAPWDGTTASTGDASYQLAFGSTAVNGTGVPWLNIRNGIDSTWNSWRRIITDNGAGNVGIGTTAPLAKLHVNAATNQNLWVTANTNTLDTTSIGIASINDANSSYQPLSFVASRYNFISGNVGINTTAPTQKLDVNGTVALYGKVAFEGADTWLRINQSSTFTSGTYFGSNIIRTDGQLQVGPSGSVFLVNTAGNVGINTTTPADRLQVVGGYVSDMTGRLARNLLDTNSWTVSNGTVGNWWHNGNSVTVNQRLWNNDPFGNPALVWRGVSDGSLNSPSGGWNYYNIPITDTKAYRSSVWFRVNAGAGGNLYLGLDGGNTTDLANVANTNPYFHAIPVGNFVAGRWYLFVGYIHASNDPSATSYSAIYDGVTGQKVFSGTDYKNKAGATTQAQRTYSYYNTALNTTVDMWGPRFEQMDGSEPSVGALLGGTGSSANPMYVNGNCTGGVTINWALGSTQHCTMTGPVTFTFTNGISGGNYRLVLLQDATGGRTASWPASVRWGSMGVPALTATPSKTDYIGFLYNGVSGAYDGIAFNSNF